MGGTGTPERPARHGPRMAKKETRAIHSGRQSRAHFGAVNTPVYRASTILFPDLDAIERADQPYVYGRRGTPTTRSLEEAVTALEGGAQTVLTPSGLSAVTTAILAACDAGSHLLMTDNCYQPTRQFCGRTLKRLGVEVTYFDPLIGAGIASLFHDNTRAVFLESPGSLTFEVADVPAIAEAAHARGIAVLLDNTWATPFYFDAHGHGVDLSIMAATKYVVGHADAMLGYVSATEAHKNALVRTHGELGLCVSGDDAYLGLRGLRTMAVRLERHGRTALELARWLGGRPEVARVLYPALESDPGYGLWKRDFTGASGLFGLELKPVTKEALRAFVNGLEYFGMGYSWGGFESLIVPAHITRTASRFAAEGPVLRIHAGLEDIDDLKADLDRGFARLRAAA